MPMTFPYVQPIRTSYSVKAAIVFHSRRRSIEKSFVDARIYNAQFALTSAKVAQRPYLCRVGNRDEYICFLHRRALSLDNIGVTADNALLILKNEIINGSDTLSTRISG